jgi:hypothetical protein
MMSLTVSPPALNIEELTATDKRENSLSSGQVMGSDEGHGQSDFHH